MARKRKKKPSKAPGGIVTVKGYKRKLGQLPPRTKAGRFTRSGSGSRSRKARGSGQGTLF